jgi:hypothetical protein
VTDTVALFGFTFWIGMPTKASVKEDFMSLFPTRPNFGNGAEEFHPHETLSAPMKLLSSLSS